MAKNITFDDLGTELQNIVIGYNEDIQKAALKQTKESAKNLANTLKKTTPKGRSSQHLADSWKESTKVTTAGIEATIFSDPKKKVQWRAHFLEFGTSHSRAQPFMIPAYNQEDYEKKLQEIIKNIK